MLLKDGLKSESQFKNIFNSLFRLGVVGRFFPIRAQGHHFNIQRQEVPLQIYFKITMIVKISEDTLLRQIPRYLKYLRRSSKL